MSIRRPAYGEDFGLERSRLRQSGEPMPVAFDPDTENEITGAFILIDRYSNATVAAGLIAFALRRATNVHLQALTVTKEARAQLKYHRPCVLWFTGLSGAANRRSPIVSKRG